VISETDRASTRVNILFTSAGRRVELLQAFRQAYTSLNIEGNIVALDVDPIAPSLQVADIPYIVPRLIEADYLSTLLSICEREHINLILPLIDPDIVFLAHHRATIEATGACLAVVSETVAAITADKWLTTCFFRNLGLSTPASWLPTDFNATSALYPCFIKPRQGSASQDTFRLDNAREASFFLDYVPDPLIQEYIAGPEITTDVICDVTGQLLGLVSRQRIAVRAGEVAKGVTVFDPRIADACVRIVDALPATGPITVQCLLRDGEPCFTEINARLGGGIPLGIAAGVDAPRLLLASAAGLPARAPVLGSYQTGLYLTRFDDSFFIMESAREAMESHRIRP